MNDFNERVANLSAKKRALLEAHLKSKERIAERAIPRRPDFAPAPLSFAQQRMWFMDQLQPGNPAYNRSTHIHLRGALNIAVFDNSLNEIVRRHEILRTSFLATDGQPVQAVASSLTLSLPVIDLGSLPAHEQQAEVSRIVTEDAQHSFDLSRVPLLKVQLVRLGETEHLLVLTLHHIVFDGWSAGILMRELSTLYKALSAGEQPTLPELPIQFADFARWQRRRMQGGVLDAQLAHWKTKLSGQLPLLELSTDRARPPAQTFRGARQHLSLPANVSASLKSLSQREGATLFMTLLAAFQALLHRYTGGEDIIVGVPIAGRNRLEVENLIGIFINTLALRTDLSGNPSFRQLLGRVRTTALEAYAHQELPFERLVEELQPVRDLSRTPVFQVLFQLRNLPDERVDANEDLRMAEADFDSGSAKLDLALDIVNKPEGLSCVAEYNTDLFDAASIARLLNHYENLLRGLLDNPNARLSELPLLTEVERKQLLLDWNETHADYPQHATVQSLFEAQVESSPDAIALIFKDEQLTYAELNAKSNRLAHHLIVLGVGPEVLVGICAERSMEMIVGLLGILKAAGAWVPLDPDYPKERLSFMLEDAQVAAVVTQKHLEGRLPQHRARRVYIDTLDCETYPDTDAIAQPHHLAYVIYTSGSTGRPKGVMIEHRCLVNYIEAAARLYRLQPEDRILQFASISFDVSVREIFMSLTSGATLVLCPDPRMDAERFFSSCRGWRITLLSLPTAYWHGLANAIDSEGLQVEQSLRLISAGGEKMLADRLAVWRRAAPHLRLINSYGPTETTVSATAWEAPHDCDMPAPIPIGRPLANTTVYILDLYLNPVPIGVPGEIHIGGAGLARGYLNRPELTTQKFIRNPFSDDPEARLYKTGDLARYLGDGNIEFIGRIDTQVKIRGFRIELGEIEAVLMQHRAVGEAVVIATDTARGDKRLVAYVVKHEDASPSELHGFLKDKLPEYMLPSAIVVLDRLPISPNGKLDRQALPAPEYRSEEAFVAPQTPTEETLAAIWAQVLKLDQIGIHDNFFDLGGHSLLATQVISRVRAAFDIDLPLHALFEGPTIRDLAVAIISHANPRKHAIRRLPRTGAEQIFPLSLAQQRLWFIQQLEPGSGTYNITKALRLRGALDVSALTQSLNEIIRRHESLRTAFSDDGEKQLVQPTVTLEVPLSDLSELAFGDRKARIGRLAADHATQPFDLSRAPLLRAQLIRFNDDDHVLFLSMHHIVSDGTSLGLLYRELSELYRAYRSGQPAQLQELPVQYADFASWQRRYLDGGAMSKQLAYWKKQLGGKLPPLELPLDRPRPAMQRYEGGKYVMSLPENLVEAVKELSRGENVTLFTTFLAAFQLLLYRLSGQEDILIGAPIAGRNRIETEPLIGFFIGTLVIRGDLSGNPSFKELIQRTRKTALEAYENQDVPFEKLVEELQPERNLSRNPIFDVLINYITRDQIEPLRLDDVAIESLMIEERLAKFSMTLYIRADDHGLELDLSYQTALFSSERIACVLEQYRQVLEQICTAPERAINDYSLIAPASKTLLPDPAQPLAEPYQVLTHDAIARWVRDAGAEVALYQEGRSLSYAGLWSAAQTIARTLRDRGLARGDVIAISGPKSFGLIACLIAALLSGGVMLILDRRFPVERQRLLVRETGAKHILYAGDFRDEDEWMRELDAKTILEVNADSAMAQSTVAINRTASDLPKLAPNDPAYIFFTSGTTGVPKGILGSHKGLSHFLAWQRATFAIGPGDRVAQLTSLSFDVLLREVFLPLTSGAGLHLPDEDEGIAADYVLPWLARQRITVLHTVPALAQSWLVNVPRGLSLPDLRWVFFAGEPLNDALVARWRNAFSFNGSFINLYGPTEITLAKCFHRVIDEEPLGVQPVGRPLPQTQALVMSASNQLCGIGEPGEIAIRTPFRTLGYINAPDEQRNRFIKNPFRDDENDLLYLTGDRGRYRPDGTLMIEGRLDHQVKINGVRVEPGEAGAILAQHAALQACFVTARKDDQGENFLVAYVVVKSEVEASDLRTFLSAKLPTPLVPSAFVFLDSLPLTVNGKVDRKALPAPERTVRSEQDFVAPRTPNEQALAAIWAQVLKLDQIGIHDNFFDLGGHSLRATQVISRVKKTLGADIQLRALFESPTVAALSALIVRKQAEGLGEDELTQLLAEAQEQGSQPEQ